MPAPILATVPLAAPWETLDPFLFCMHHVDAYPAGDGGMRPAASLAGRELGMDFGGRDGWSMYHGRTVPGFPAHPHYGFETVTIVRRGFIDHADSLGAGARFGAGDVQWVTAGRGIVHSEMFPLLRTDAGNPLELFQIWLNLPRASKRAAPHFTMLWAEAVPHLTSQDRDGRTTEVTVVAGGLGGARPPPPPPESWAAAPEHEVVIATLTLAPGARYALPPASPGVSRTLFFFAGAALAVGGRPAPARHRLDLTPDVTAELENGPERSQLLLLQGRPIAEPTVKHGPFVANAYAEIGQVVAEYRRTEFGGWPWQGDDPVHPAAAGRFARYPDGRIERPDATPSVDAGEERQLGDDPGLLLGEGVEPG